MGITGLTARLQQYAIPVQWQKPDQDAIEESTEDRLIIDGPALAYHVYHTCLARNSSARNAFEAYPSYHEVADAVLFWLDNIASFGLIVHRIYFDGYLPEAKAQIRSERLQGYLRQLRLHRLYSEKPRRAKPGPSRDERAARTPTSRATSPDTTAVRPRLSALPALPFLVPVVLETLRRSKYFTVTSMVASEADEACEVEASKISGSIVLTSDSDLLVHCQDGLVMFFSDIELGESCFKSKLYKPHDISRSLGCTSFRPIAHAMANDTHVSATQAAAIAKKDAKTAVSNAERWYDAEMGTNPFLRTDLLSAASELQVVLATSDPRASELFISWYIKTQTPSGNGDKKIQMYLPFLIDDPTRSSAWQASAYYRKCAYSLLRIHNNREPAVSEVDRRGEQMREVSVTYEGAYECADLCRRLFLDLSTMGADVVKWRKYALLSVIRQLGQQEATMPPQDVVLEALTGVDRGVPNTWPQIHLKAQIEAFLYSLRMLRFAAIVTLQQYPESAKFETDLLSDLKKCLGTMPKLVDCMSSPNEPLSLESDYGPLRMEILSLYPKPDIYPNGRIVIQDEEIRSKKKRKTNDGKSSAQPSEQRGLGNNIYSLLSES